MEENWVIDEMGDNDYVHCTRGVPQGDTLLDVSIDAHGGTLGVPQPKCAWRDRVDLFRFQGGNCIDERLRDA